MEEKEQYWVSSNLDEQRFEDIVRLLRFTDWAKTRHESIIRKSLEHSISFGVFAGTKQVGHARVITDTATFAYLADVVIDPEYRGRGLSKMLMEAVMRCACPQN